MNKETEALEKINKLCRYLGIRNDYIEYHSDLPTKDDYDVSYMSIKDGNLEIHTYLISGHNGSEYGKQKFVLSHPMSRLKELDRLIKHLELLARAKAVNTVKANIQKDQERMILAQAFALLQEELQWKL